MLKQGGAAFTTGSAGGWVPIGAEKTSTGYQVVWKISGADQYSVWNTDNNGNYIANAIGVVSGASATLLQFETSFQQDFNGDGSIGSAALIESAGSTSRVKVGNHYYLNSPGGGTSLLLKQGGAAFAAGSAGGWVPIGAEKTSSGYQVVWKISGADQYSVWNTDSNGNYIANAIGVVSEASATLLQFETSFQQDFNGDGSIGIATLIEFRRFDEPG